jgi:GNAT superfamily N-acetyltransferase
MLVELWKILMDEHKKIEPELYDLSNDAEEKIRAFFLSSINSEEKFLYGAYDKNKLVGYAFGWIESRPPVLRVQDVGNLSDICVNPKYRSKGIGNQLVNTFVGWCNKKGVNIIQLQVLYDKDAVGFYKKIGFRNFMRKMVINTRDCNA